jgi:starch synthase
VPYGIKNIESKKKNKEFLQKEMGLEVSDVPLIAAVTRLVEHKGIELILEALQKLDKPYQFILLGSGNMYYEKMFECLAVDEPEKISVCFEFDEALARRIYAGSDIFLMPSLYEPCGLGQMYAMRYGSIPVVRSTGGLKDTVVDYEKKTSGANGFSFKGYNSGEFLEAIEKALGLYNTPEWDRLIKNAMKCDWSFKNSAVKYVELYRKLL